MSTKEQAVQTAGARLEHLELWARRQTIALIAIAAMMAITTTVILYGAWQYYQAKTAVLEARAEASKAFEDMRSGLGPPRPNLGQARNGH